MARALYERYPDFSEGRLAKVRSHVVSRASCAVVARDLGLDRKLRETAATGLPTEELERLSHNRNVLAAILEAALAALFLEHGFERIESAVVEAFDPRIEYALTSHVDHKTELQEALARTGRAVVSDEEVGRGSGRSKKAAEQEAAKEALAHLALVEP